MELVTSDKDCHSDNNLHQCRELSTSSSTLATLTSSASGLGLASYLLLWGSASLRMADRRIKVAFKSSYDPAKCEWGASTYGTDCPNKKLPGWRFCEEHLKRVRDNWDK